VSGAVESPPSSAGTISGATSVVLFSSGMLSEGGVSTGGASMPLEVASSADSPFSTGPPELEVFGGSPLLTVSVSGVSPPSTTELELEFELELLDESLLSTVLVELESSPVEAELLDCPDCPGSPGAPWEEAPALLAPGAPAEL
jgi:hypothetical protein